MSNDVGPETALNDAQRRRSLFHFCDSPETSADEHEKLKINTLNLWMSFARDYICFFSHQRIQKRNTVFNVNSLSHKRRSYSMRTCHSVSHWGVFWARFQLNDYSIERHSLSIAIETIQIYSNICSFISLKIMTEIGETQTDEYRRCKQLIFYSMASEIQWFYCDSKINEISTARRGGIKLISIALFIKWIRFEGRAKKWS